MATIITFNQSKEIREYFFYLMQNLLIEFPENITVVPFNNLVYDLKTGVPIPYVIVSATSREWVEMGDTIKRIFYKFKIDWMEPRLSLVPKSVGEKIVCPHCQNGLIEPIPSKRLGTVKICAECGQLPSTTVRRAEKTKTETGIISIQCPWCLEESSMPKNGDWRCLNPDCKQFTKQWAA